VTFAGTDFPWWSWQSAAFVGATVVLGWFTLRIERRAPEPLVPLKVLANRTAVLAIVASVSVGIAMFGGTTFLGQYFQVAQGYSPTKAGLMTIPLMVAAMLSSTVAGQIISRTGRWKAFLVGGAIFLVVGLVGLSLLRHDTPGWESGLSMAIMGLGMGALMQNLVLAVQNTVDVRDIGAASAAVSFFRSLGGAIGVSALGAVLANLVQNQVRDGLVALGPAVTAASGSGDSGTLDLKSMPPVIASIVRTAYGDATGRIFLVAAVVAVVALVAVFFIREAPLRTTVALERPENVVAERS
jgi:predicted MFS family arabinose efflux permease